MEAEGQVKRIGIFAMYDEDGIVDDYRLYLIREIKLVVSRLIVVVNGCLDANSIARIGTYTDEVVFREDKGYDCTAIKEIITDYVRWDGFKDYDELLWCNDSIFGPFVSFSQMIEDMDACKCDFWGITRQAAFLSGYEIPEHIQPVFWVTRSRLLHSEEFRKFWDELPEITDYASAIDDYELRLTQFFESNGYVGASYVDVFGDKEHIQENDLGIMNHPYSMLAVNHLPAVKKKCFTRNRHDLLAFSAAEDSIRILDYITKNTDYDTDYIWKYLIRVMNPASLNEALNLRYILSDKICEGQRFFSGKAAVIAHVNYEELVEECFRYLKNIPEEIDLYINTKTESTKEKIYHCIDTYGMKNCKVVTIGSSGREIRGMLMEGKAVFQKYEYVCFVHDKRTTSAQTNPVLGQKYMELIWENTVKSRAYIYNCLHLFEENKYLGLLVPPPPYHDIYLGMVGNYWSGNYRITKSLAEKLRLNCKMEYEISPITLGTAFWCRTDALEPLYDYPFREDDFPAEPVSSDQTLNHAIERIFSFVAQSQGYATGMVMNKEFAEVHIENYQHMAHGLLAEITKGHESILLDDVQHIPNDLWPLVETRKEIFVYGAGANAKRMIQILHRLEISIAGIIVSDSNRTEPSFLEYKVYELSEIELNPESMGIIVAVQNHDSIVRNLNKKGMYAYCLMQ